MKPLTEEWLHKAEGDYATAQRELRARRLPNYDAACFHAQQCIEKYLKAVLQEHDVAIGKTHNLVHLLDKVLPFYPQVEKLRAHLQELNAYAIGYRYPGDSADREIARRAIAACRNARQTLLDEIVTQWVSTK